MRKTIKVRAAILALICTVTFSGGMVDQYSYAESSITVTAAEIKDEGDHDGFHWAVDSGDRLIISPKANGGSAVISDFYTTLENPDPLAQEHYMEIVEYQPWQKYSDSITSVIIEDGITAVGAYAFHDMPKLTNVSMADSVGRIGKKAFYALPIETVKISQGLQNIEESAFQGTYLTELVLPDGLMTIGNSAFRNCTELVSLALPNTLTRIGSYAFSGCTSLSDVTIPDSVSALARGSFYGCTDLCSVSFGKGLTDIPLECFSGCTSLESVIIDGNISAVGTSAFSDCTSLSYVYLSDKVTSLGDYALSGCTEPDTLIVMNPTLEMPTSWTIGGDNNAYTIYGIAGSTAQEYAENNGITFEVYGDIGDKVYPLADGLTWTIKDGTLIISGKGDIPDYTFTGDSLSKDSPWAIFAPEITAVVVDEGVTRIGNKAFIGLENATYVTLPATLETIGDNAFQGCGFEKIVIPDGVKEIGMQALKGCTDLTELELPSTLEIVPDSLCSGCTSLKTVSLSEGTKIIGDSAFSFCTALEMINFPETLIEIKAAAFTNCTSLRNVDLGDHLNIIGGAAFQGCSGLRTLDLGSSVTMIGTSAFQRCGLTGEIIIPATVSSVGSNAFLDCPNIKAYRVLAPKLTLDNRKYPLGYASGADSYQALPVTIYGYAGSKTQGYTYNENAFTFVPLDWDFPMGDVNLDGDFNVADVVALQKWLLAVPDVQLTYWQNADFCADGKLDVFDLCMMKRELINEMEK